LAILKQELQKSKLEYKNYHGYAICNFKCGDRVIIKYRCENYVVVDVEDINPALVQSHRSPVSNITLQQVDILGRALSDNLIVGTLSKKYTYMPFAWYNTEQYPIIFGINDDEGVRIKSVDAFVSCPVNKIFITL
jgi:hypothetical protein